MTLPKRFTRCTDAKQWDKVELAMNSPKEPQLYDERFDHASAVGYEKVKVHLLNGETLRSQKIAPGSRGFQGCIAYHQDDLWDYLASLGKETVDNIDCRTVIDGKPVSHTCVQYPFGKRGTYDDYVGAFYLPQVKAFLQLFVYVPLILLDPNPESPKFYKQDDLIELTDEKTDFGVRYKLPNFVLYSPPLWWLALGLIREAHGFIESEVYPTDNPFNKKFPSLLLDSLDDKVIRRAIGGSYLAATQVWRVMKPYLATLATGGNSGNDVWFAPGYMDDPLFTYGHTDSRNGTYMPTVSSIHEFERLVLSGGWTALPTSLSKNWNLAQEFMSHGKTAIGWESFILAFAGSSSRAGNNSYSSTWAWVSEIDRFPKVKVLVHNIQQIRARHMQRLYEIYPSLRK